MKILWHKVVFIFEFPHKILFLIENYLQVLFSEVIFLRTVLSPQTGLQRPRAETEPDEECFQKGQF